MKKCSRPGILSLVVSTLLSPGQGILHFCYIFTVFLISTFLFILSQDLHLSAYLLSTLSIRAFRLLIIVVLNSWSYNPNISAMSSSVACPASSNCIVFVGFIVCLFFGIPCNCSLIAGHDVPGERNCSRQTFSNMVMRYWGSGSVL